MKILPATFWMKWFCIRWVGWRTYKYRDAVNKEAYSSRWVDLLRCTLCENVYVYQRKPPNMQNFTPMSMCEVVWPLLSMSLMSARRWLCMQFQITSLVADTHASHIQDVFDLFQVHFAKGAVCQVADNCSVNTKIAEKLSIPHVGCSNHLLNIKVLSMVNADPELKFWITYVYKTMTDCRSLLINMEMLRNFTALAPIEENKTRWSGKFLMMQWFNRIKDSLRNVE